MEIYKIFVCNIMQLRTIINKEIKKIHFYIKDLVTQFSLQYISMPWRGNFGQLKIVTVHDYTIVNESLEYLRGTPWEFLDIVQLGLKLNTNLPSTTTTTTHQELFKGLKS